MDFFVCILGTGVIVNGQEVSATYVVNSIGNKP